MHHQSFPYPPQAETSPSPPQGIPVQSVGASLPLYRVKPRPCECPSSSGRSPPSPLPSHLFALPGFKESPQPAFFQVSPSSHNPDWVGVGLAPWIFGVGVTPPTSPGFLLRRREGMPAKMFAYLWTQDPLVGLQPGHALLMSHVRGTRNGTGAFRGFRPAGLRPSYSESCRGGGWGGGGLTAEGRLSSHGSLSFSTPREGHIGGLGRWLVGSCFMQMHTSTLKT